MKTTNRINRLHGTLMLHLNLHFGEDTVRADVVYTRKRLWVYAGIVMIVDYTVQFVAFPESNLSLSQMR